MKEKKNKYWGTKCSVDESHNVNGKCLRYFKKNCVECSKKASRQYYDNFKMKKLKVVRVYDSLDKNKENRKKHSTEHREEINERQRKKYNSDPNKRIAKTCSSKLRNAVHNLKYNFEIPKYFDFTANEFRDHIQNLFEEWMTWGNYGEWEIDHIIPKSKFNYNNDYESSAFKKCWSLDNLRPLHWRKNRKRNLIEE